MKSSKFTTWAHVLAKPIAAFVIVATLFGPFSSLVNTVQAVWCLPANGGPAINAFRCSPGDIEVASRTAAPTPQQNINASFDAVQRQQQGDQMGCFQGSGSWQNTLAVCLSGIIYIVTVGIGSAFAYVAAIFFNFAVALSLNSYSYAIDFIATGWTVARDIANMFFILILVFIAFSIMLNAESVGTMRNLVWVIFIALIINFSFFFTRVAIDVSNILAVQFYNAIPAQTIAQTLQGATSPTGIAASTVGGAIGLNNANSKDLTATIMNALQLQNLFNTSSFQQYAKSSNSGFWTTMIALTFIYIAAAIFFWLLTIAFVTNGIKFLMRVVVLWLLIIASPLAFIAAAIPQTSEWFKKWRDTLISYSIYPIVFMFIFLILSNIMAQFGNCPSITSAVPLHAMPGSSQGCLMGDLFSSLGQVNSQNPNFFVWLGAVIANVGIRLGLVIALLYIGMKAADHIGLMGAEFAGKIGSTIGNKGLLRMYNVGYKHSIGRGLGAIDYGLSKTKFGNRSLGYELRRYVTKPLAGTKIPGSHGETYKEMKERDHKESPEKAAGLRDKDNRILLQEIETGRDYNIGKTLTPAEIDVRKAKLKTFAKRELEAAGAGTLEKNAAYWSESQMKTIKDSEKYTDSQKEKVNAAWHEKSDDAPLQKAQKQINELRKINDTLSATYRVGSISGRVGTTAAPIIATIDASVIEDMLKNSANGINKQLAKIDSDIAVAARGGADTTALRQEKINLQQAAKSLENLNNERKNIPAKVGGEEEAGKFKNS